MNLKELSVLSEVANRRWAYYEMLNQAYRRQFNRDSFRLVSLRGKWGKIADAAVEAMTRITQKGMPHSILSKEEDAEFWSLIVLDGMQLSVVDSLRVYCESLMEEVSAIEGVIEVSKRRALYSVK